MLLNSLDATINVVELSCRSLGHDGGGIRHHFTVEAAIAIYKYHSIPKMLWMMHASVAFQEKMPRKRKKLSYM